MLIALAGSQTVLPGSGTLTSLSKQPFSRNIKRMEIGNVDSINPNYPNHTRQPTACSEINTLNSTPEAHEESGPIRQQ